MGIWDSCKEGFTKVGNFITGGGEERKRSERIIRNAKSDQSEAEEKLELKRNKLNETLENLGELRKSVNEDNIRRFLEIWEAFHPQEDNGAKNIGDHVDSRREFALPALPELSSSLKNAAVGSGVGALGGAAAAYGAYGLAGVIGTASTGTAISSLSGVAATNATLAWLGGGALSAGGLGAMGGTLALGGIALIPATIVAMYFGQSAAKKKLNQAYEYSYQVDEFVAQCETFIKQLDQIEHAALLLTEVITYLDDLLGIYNTKLEKSTDLVVKNFNSLQELLCMELVTVSEFELVSNISAIAKQSESLAADLSIKEAA